MLELLKRLCDTDAPSGREESVRSIIISEIEGHCEYRIDALGNLIVFKKGKKRSVKKVMLDAHMDEVGFMVTGIDDGGFLSFTEVGGVDTAAFAGARVRINGISGVIGTVPVHLLSAAEREKKLSVDALYIDIGAESRSDAEKYVSTGDAGTFENEFALYGGMVKSKALDDRIGCALLVEMIKSDIEYDLYFTFTVQEEVGLRGAKTAAYSVAPDYAIVLEGTTAADIPSVSGAERVCAAGCGPAVSFMDRTALYDRSMYETAFRLAEENGIPCQPKSLASGGNNAGSIQSARGGVRCLAVSVPVRYLHSPACMADISDMENTGRLALLLAEELAAGE